MVIGTTTHTHRRHILLFMVVLPRTSNEEIASAHSRPRNNRLPSKSPAASRGAGTSWKCRVTDSSDCHPDRPCRSLRHFYGRIQKRHPRSGGAPGSLQPPEATTATTPVATLRASSIALMPGLRSPWLNPRFRSHRPSTGDHE